MAVAKPVFIDPPSLRLRSWWMTRDVRVGGGERVGELRRAVGRLVVDDDQLVVDDLSGGDHRDRSTPRRPQPTARSM